MVAGYNWCVDSLKESYYGILANELEMNNAITFLKRNDIPHAIETLKLFEKKEDKIAYIASVNLSFIYFLVSIYLNQRFYIKTQVENLLMMHGLKFTQNVFA